MAPINFWPVLFVTFPVLVWLIDGAAAARWRGVRRPRTGWWFGFGYFLAGLYWVGYAFLVDAKTFGWLLPFAVIGAARRPCRVHRARLRARPRVWTRGALRILTLAAALTMTEWLRGHVLTGFPWNAFGYALTAPLALAQSAALFGLWGLTFIAVAVFASPALFADERATRRRSCRSLGAVALLAALALYGAVRLAATRPRFVDGVQPAHHAAEPAAGREVQLRRQATR